MFRIPDLLQTWKLVTLGAGLAGLLSGARYYQFEDWDAGISILMGLMAYLFAPWSVRSLYRRLWHRLPLILFLYWLTVDGIYVGYNALLGHWYIRDTNFYASSCLYWLCGFIWFHEGPLRELLNKTAKSRRS